MYTDLEGRSSIGTCQSGHDRTARANGGSEARSRADLPRSVGRVRRLSAPGPGRSGQRPSAHAAQPHAAHTTPQNKGKTHGKTINHGVKHSCRSIALARGGVGAKSASLTAEYTWDIPTYNCRLISLFTYYKFNPRPRERDACTATAHDARRAEL